MTFYVSFVERSLERLNTCARIAISQRRLGDSSKVGATSLILGISNNLALFIITGESVKPLLTKATKKTFDGIIIIFGGIFRKSVIEELSNRRQEDQEK